MIRNDEIADRAADTVRAADAVPAGEGVVGADGAVGRTEFTFESADGESEVRAVLWVPLAMERTAPSGAAGADGAPEGQLGCFRPRGVVQLIHGMAEHIDRYDDFARSLACAGYLVCGHDHIGHGETAGSAARRGVIGADGGAAAMIRDVGHLRLLVSQQVVPGTPYFMFGHSMGSLVLRGYLPLYGEGLAGAVICGTANENGAVAAAGNLLARAIAAVRGDGYKSKLLHSLADGAYSRAIKDARTPFDWLSRDPAVADAFMADERAGFMFGAGAYATLTELARRANDPAAYREVPHGLPLLFVSGDADPVGNNGKGVEAAAESMEKAGVEDVTLKLFPGMRHEILNEIGKEEVYDFVLEWIEARS